MPAYNFHKRFAADVEAGRKRQTIRRKRKRPTKPGDVLYLYTGQRTKQCRKLGEAVCESVVPILIMGLYNITLYPEDNERRRALGGPEIDRLALDDGFASASGLERFFWKELPFKGEIVRWEAREAQ